MGIKIRVCPICRTKIPSIPGVYLPPKLRDLFFRLRKLNRTINSYEELDRFVYRGAACSPRAGSVVLRNLNKALRTSDFYVIVRVPFELRNRQDDLFGKAREPRHKKLKLTPRNQIPKP